MIMVLFTKQMSALICQVSSDVNVISATSFLMASIVLYTISPESSLAYKTGIRKVTPGYDKLSRYNITKLLDKFCFIME